MCQIGQGTLSAWAVMACSLCKGSCEATPRARRSSGFAYSVGLDSGAPGRKGSPGESNPSPGSGGSGEKLPVGARGLTVDVEHVQSELDIPDLGDIDGIGGSVGFPLLDK